MISQTAYAAIYAACGDFHTLSGPCRTAIRTATSRRSIGDIDVYNVTPNNSTHTHTHTHSLGLIS